MQLFQHGMSKDFYPGSTDTESCNAGIVILPGYSLDVAKGFEIQDYSDVLLRYVPWDEDFDLEFTQTLHLEKSETSDGFRKWRFRRISLWISCGTLFMKSCCRTIIMCG